MISQSVTDDNVPVVVSTRSASSEGIRLTHEARIVRRYSSATDFSCHATSSSTSGPCLVRRGRLTFPSDHTVQIGHGDGIIIQRFEEPEDAGPSTALAHTRVTSAQEQNESMRELELSQVDVIHEAESTLDEIDDESLMQVLHDSQNVEQVNDLPIDVDLGHQSPSCALGIEIQGDNEQDGFQFHPNAAAFQPGQPLPQWAQVIEEIYHTWDLEAFSWQAEERSAQFMTWFVAPGANRRLCRIGREVTLLADFWNWKERLRQTWINEIGPNGDLEIVLVQPPPTFLDERNAGHIILIQHNGPEWASVLLTVFDPYLSVDAPFQLAASVSEQLLMQQLLLPAGYPVEVAHDTLCTFRLRNHNQSHFHGK